jgi:hypothetical protein
MLSTLSFYTLIFLYPLITGPLAALVFLQVVQRNKARQVLLFWPGLLIVNVVGFVFLITISGEELIDPTFFSCLVTPIFAVLSALMLRIRGRSMAHELADNPHYYRWLTLGTFLIPLLQIVTMGSFVLFAPYLCEIGLRSCWPG